MLNLLFRARFWLHALIYVAGFTMSGLPAGTTAQRVWLILPELISTRFRVDLNAAVLGVTVLATALAFAAACLRTWGTACLGAGVVFDSALQGQRISAAGPYRYVRNPLYIGTVLHTLALCTLMSWPGAVFSVVAIVLLQAALVASEERYLKGSLGEPYQRYMHEVPRWMPRFRSSAPDSALEGKWGQAIAAELYMWGAAISFAAFGWKYNAVLILQGLLVSFGLSIVVRGLMKKG